MRERVIHVRPVEYVQLLRTEVFAQIEYLPGESDRRLLGYLFDRDNGIEVRLISELDTHHE